MAQMTQVFLILLILFQTPVFAASFMGTLRKEKDRHYLDSERQSYELLVENQEVERQLDQLGTGDLIIGQGELSEESHTLYIDSIDYVGLTQILGVWMGEKMVLKFKSFDEFSLLEFQKTGKNQYSQWKYSLSPLGENTWALFFSNEKDTNLARLYVESKQVTLEFIDGENGQILKRSQLRKSLF